MLTNSRASLTTAIRVLLCIACVLAQMQAPAREHKPKGKVLGYPRESVGDFGSFTDKEGAIHYPQHSRPLPPLETQGATRAPSEQKTKLPPLLKGRWKITSTNQKITTSPEFEGPTERLEKLTKDTVWTISQDPTTTACEIVSDADYKTALWLDKVQGSIPANGRRFHP